MELAVFLGALALGALLVGAATWRVTRSVPLGVLAGVLSLAAGLLHSVHGFVLAVGESGETLSGYDRFVQGQWTVLLVVYTAGPAIALVAVRALWIRASARPCRGPRRAAPPT